MRKNIVAGNWKMNKNFQEAEALMLQLAEYKKNNKTNCEVYIAPPSLYLTTAKNIFAKIKNQARMLPFARHFRA